MRITPLQVVSVLLALTLIVGGASLWAQWDEVHASEAARQRQGEVIIGKLCLTFGKLGALKPPPGNPVVNPARGYDQELHVTLVQLGTDLGCRIPLCTDTAGTADGGPSWSGRPAGAAAAPTHGTR